MARTILGLLLLLGLPVLAQDDAWQCNLELNYRGFAGSYELVTVDASGLARRRGGAVRLTPEALQRIRSAVGSPEFQSLQTDYPSWIPYLCGNLHRNITVSAGGRERCWSTNRAEEAIFDPELQAFLKVWSAVKAELPQDWLSEPEGAKLKLPVGCVVDEVPLGATRAEVISRLGIPVEGQFCSMWPLQIGYFYLNRTLQALEGRSLRLRDGRVVEAGMSRSVVERAFGPVAKSGFIEVDDSLFILVTFTPEGLVDRVFASPSVTYFLTPALPRPGWFATGTAKPAGFL